jgi:hypothetical protein
MWRTDGQGEFYTYLPPYTESRFSANRAQCNYKNSDCNPTYGASIGRGTFHFKAGGWTQVSQRVRLNTVGKADGELELFADGKSVIKLGGLILRDSNSGRIRGIQAQTFFGGSKTQFQAKKNEDVYFSDFTVAVVRFSSLFGLSLLFDTLASVGIPIDAKPKSAFYAKSCHRLGVSHHTIFRARTHHT